MKKNKFIVFKDIITIFTIILFITSLGIITIINLNKKVEIVYFNSAITVNTLSATVREVLVENNIYVNDTMNISYDLDNEIFDSMTIEINSNEEYANIDIESLENELEIASTKIAFEEVSVPFEETEVENDSVATGISTVKEEGEDGINNEVYFVKSLTDSEIKLKVEEIEVEKAVDRVIEVGTSSVISVSSTTSNVVVPAVDDGFKVYDISLSESQQQYTYYLANKYGFEYELLLTVMYKESGFNASAIGGGNSYGLCQIHYSNFTNLSNILGITNFLDPYENIEAGAYMLDLYLDSAAKKFSDIESIEVYALNSYNMGEGNYYSTCYSQGIFERDYSTSIITMRDNLVENGSF